MSVGEGKSVGFLVCFSMSLGTLQLAKDTEEQVAVKARLPEVAQRWEPFDLEIQVSNGKCLFLNPYG